MQHLHVHNKAYLSLTFCSLCLIQTVPCPPENVKSNLLCSSNSAHVQWNPGAGAESYEVHAINTGGQMTLCDSTNTSCVIPNLVCGSIYNISVLAIGHHCNVSRSEITTLHSGWLHLIKQNTIQCSWTFSVWQWVLASQLPFCPQCHVSPTRFRQTWAVDPVWLMCPGSLAKALSRTLFLLMGAGGLHLHATAVAPHASLVIYCVDSHTASAWLPPTMCVPAHQVIVYSWTQVGWLYAYTLQIFTWIPIETS